MDPLLVYDRSPGWVWPCDRVNDVPESLGKARKNEIAGDLDGAGSRISQDQGERTND